MCAILGANTRRIDSSKQIFEKEVFLGSSAQDVATALGAPCRVFYKSEDKMRIHSPNAHRRVTACKSDYFFNYFTLGMVSFFYYYIIKILLRAHLNFKVFLKIIRGAYAIVTCYFFCKSLAWCH